MTTLVLVTHDHELASMADRTISLRDGRVVADGAGKPPADETAEEMKQGVVTQ
jgi:ABC-type lipoprotein export system ATPase subunit